MHSFGEESVDLRKPVDVSEVKAVIQQTKEKQASPSKFSDAESLAFKTPVKLNPESNPVEEGIAKAKIETEVKVKSEADVKTEEKAVSDEKPLSEDNVKSEEKPKSEVNIKSEENAISEQKAASEKA